MVSKLDQPQYRFAFKCWQLWNTQQAKILHERRSQPLQQISTLYNTLNKIKGGIGPSVCNSLVWYDILSCISANWTGLVCPNTNPVQRLLIVNEGFILLILL